MELLFCQSDAVKNPEIGVDGTALDICFLLCLVAVVKWGTKVKQTCIWGERVPGVWCHWQPIRTPAFSLAGTYRATALKHWKAFVSSQGQPGLSSLCVLRWCWQATAGGKGVGKDSACSPSRCTDKTYPIKEWWEWNTRKSIILTWYRAQPHMLKNLQIGGTCLVAQWLRICLPMQGTWVRALVWEDPTCRGAAKPVRHNYRACALEPASHNYWACVPQLLKPMRLEPKLCNKRSHRNEKPAHCNEE